MAEPSEPSEPAGTGRPPPARRRGAASSIVVIVEVGGALLARGGEAPEPIRRRFEQALAQDPDVSEVRVVFA